MAITILVVDDNQSLTKILKEGLNIMNKDWNILLAHGGKECIRKLKKSKVDLVLLDIMMPDMDGWAVATKIKEDDNLKSIPIVFLTAKTDKFDIGMGKVMAADYIEKPFDISDLDKRLKKVLKK